jgi:hypothetical protein
VPFKGGVRVILMKLDKKNNNPLDILTENTEIIFSILGTPLNNAQICRVLSFLSLLLLDLYSVSSDIVYISPRVLRRRVQGCLRVALALFSRAGFSYAC